MSPNQASDYSISTLPAPPPSAAIARLHEIWQETTGSVGGYSLPLWKFEDLLTDPRAKIFVASTSSADSPSFPSTPPASGGSTTAPDSTQIQIHAFALTYLIRSGSSTNLPNQHLKGSLALLLVHPSHRHRGLGTSLHTAALSYLTQSVRDSLTLSHPQATKGQIQLGSVFPRIFPGLPEGDEFEGAKEWFESKGWVFGKEVSIDLYRTLGGEGGEGGTEGLGKLSEKAKGSGIRFGVLQEGEEEGLYELQKREFDSYTGWPDMFPALVESGHREDIYCAYAKDGKMIGATVAALPPKKGEEQSPIQRQLTWPCTLGKSCAIIACVGVSASSRGEGAGIGLVAEATQSLSARGADGCFIDWVSLKGFYQLAGFEKWNRGYRDATRTITAE